MGRYAGRGKEVAVAVTVAGAVLLGVGVIEGVTSSVVVAVGLAEGGRAVGVGTPGSRGS